MNKMNGVKEKKDNKVLTYEELAHSLKSKSLSDSVKPITIKSTQLYTRVKELTEMADPTQVNPRDKRWNYFLCSSNVLWKKRCNTDEYYGI